MERIISVELRLNAIVRGDFGFFKMAVGTVEKDEVRNFAKFCQNRLNHGCDMLLFDFSRWRPMDSGNFQRSEQERSRASNCVSVPDSVKIARTAADILLFFDFQDGGRPILDFQKFKVLKVGTVKKVELRQCAIFRHNRSNRG